MATKGTSQTFSLDDSGGTPVDITSKLTGIQTSFDAALEDSTTLGDTWRERTVTLQDGSINLNLIWDATIDAHFHGIQGLAATQTFTYGPAGSTSGLRRATGECRVANISKGAEVAGIVTKTVTLQTDGTVTFNTF